MLMPFPLNSLKVVIQPKPQSKEDEVFSGISFRPSAS